MVTPVKRYTAFNWDREKQLFSDSFEEAYKFAVGTLPSVEDGFNLEQARSEIEKDGLTSIPERNFANMCYSESAAVVDTTRHDVDEDGYYEW